MIEETTRVCGLETHLASKVLGQEDAIIKVARALEGAVLGLNDTGKKPKRTLLFMGPSGVGKTSTAKAFTEFLFGENLSMLFMNEMQSPFDVALFLNTLRAGIEQHPEGTVFLFDEIEKASKAIMDVLLSLLDEGEFTIGKDRFSVANCYIVMTSNIGAERWGWMRKTRYSVMEQFACEQAKLKLRPELFWRINEVIVFRPLDDQAKADILIAALDRKFLFLRKQFGIGRMSIDSQAQSHLIRRCFVDGGARRLEQQLDKEINLAFIPWANAGKKPEQHRFTYDARRNQLVLK